MKVKEQPDKEEITEARSRRWTEVVIEEKGRKTRKKEKGKGKER